MSRSHTWLAAGAAVAAALATVAPTAALADTSPASLATGAATTVTGLPRAPAGPRPHQMQPMWRGATAHAGVRPDSVGEPGGYDPDELRAYLDLHGTGKGQTVAIVVAFHAETSVPESLAVFDAYYGLKPPCSDTVTSNCFDLTITAPFGISPIDDTNAFTEGVSWQPEADLDVEVVHAIAPDAAITVVEAYDNFDDSMRAAVGYAASLHPAVISNSYGEPEFDGEQAVDNHCSSTGTLCVFSSGDGGNPGQYPAADPGVLAVGGTTLDVAPSGQVRSESAWLGSGGGVSPYEPLPAYQSAADPYRTGRGVPDVSFDADPNTGFSSYTVSDVPEFQYHQELWGEFGGTSVGAPAWSAILAVADGERAAKGAPPLTVDQVHAAAYTRSPKGLADITTGANGICGAICTASRGYDLVTGQGSPRPGIDTYLAARH